MLVQERFEGQYGMGWQVSGIALPVSMRYLTAGLPGHHWKRLRIQRALPQETLGERGSQDIDGGLEYLFCVSSNTP